LIPGIGCRFLFNEPVLRHHGAIPRLTGIEQQ
jgi:hypothetical protein